MRKFIRHPTDMPIEYHIENNSAPQKETLNDVSRGGLSFRTETYVEPGSDIVIRFTIHEPVYEAHGVVVRCRKNKDHYQVGVRFHDPSTEYHIRMIEQISYIEHYKKEVLEKEGRTITGKEAAMEWIQKYAKDFPSD